jgi:dTDP-4-amino-4,6-dideoxygalactose transaminase
MKQASRRNDPKIMNENEGIVLFYPNVPKGAIKKVSKTLRSRWIGQGPRVDEFEQKFKEKFCPDAYPVAVNSGTSALHLAYILAGIKPGDEVIAPVFTCTATTIPLLYMGAKVVFADITKDLVINPDHVRTLITKKTKAIVCVHYGGIKCNIGELKDFGLPLIQDSAQRLQRNECRDYLCYSFQAIKHLTTGDGGMLVVKTEEEAKKAKRLRWFGIDREAKQNGIWENDITEIGYKYQMTDIDASLGLAGLKHVKKILLKSSELFTTYDRNIDPDKAYLCSGAFNSTWLATILVDRREDLQRKLRENKIESGAIHFRNDMYSIFGGKRLDLPVMNELEDKYLVLPLHNKMSIKDVIKICKIINSGW